MFLEHYWVNNLRPFDLELSNLSNLTRSPLPVTRAETRLHVFNKMDPPSVLFVLHYNSLVVRKPVFGIFDQIPHKRGCTTTEDRWTLEISDLGSREIVLSV